MRNEGNVLYHHEVRWQDLDANWHLRNTAYAELGIHTRIKYFTEHGFPIEQFQELGFGPVLFREETRYFREVRSGERVSYTMKLAGFSPDGSHFEIHHDVLTADGVLAAVHRVEGAWMVLAGRKLRLPPVQLRAALESLPRTDDFVELKSVVKV